MKFKQWLLEDAQGSADSYGGDEVSPHDANLYDPVGHERRPIPHSEKANKVFGVKIRPKDKVKKLTPSFLRTKA